MTTQTTAAAATAAVAAALTLSSPANALTMDPGRITRTDARYAARTVFGTYAGALGQRLTIGPCRPVGKRARACNVRVGTDRYRLTARYANADREVIASAKPTSATDAAGANLRHGAPATPAASRLGTDGALQGQGRLAISSTRLTFTPPNRRERELFRGPGAAVRPQRAALSPDEPRSASGDATIVRSSHHGHPPVVRARQNSVGVKHGAPGPLRGQGLSGISPRRSVSHPAVRCKEGPDFRGSVA